MFRSDKSRPLVGIIPAAGLGTRLGWLNQSKEMIRLSFRESIGAVPHPAEDVCQKPVAQFLAEHMVRAGCERIFIVIRPGKWDIIDYFGCGDVLGVPVAYLTMGVPYGPPFTISQALPFIGNADVAMGFPDILIAPNDVFCRIRDRLWTTDADIVLGTFPAVESDGADLIRANSEGQVIQLLPKEEQPFWDGQEATWLVAFWRVPFSRFLAHETARLARLAAQPHAPTPPEWPVGALVARAIAQGLSVRSVHFSEGRFLDVGTPERLAKAGAFLAKTCESPHP